MWFGMHYSMVMEEEKDTTQALCAQQQTTVVKLRGCLQEERTCELQQL